ncbi:translation initiation factor IF-2-like [Lutra lutra]|uniref:translation initiation factor IF-2-like n=1 Tax=Lutra lutra TaxID=9657 RepID=UPI001FD15FF4|nr:translation initiation factor IF-2-like [Lutra lutra]
MTPGPRPPGPTGLLQAQRGSARRAPTRHRLPSRAKWEGSTGKVSTARAGLRPRTGHMCYPGGTVTHLLPLLQGGTAAPRPALICFPRCINSARERLRLPSFPAPAGRHAPRGNGPTLTLAVAMLRPECGRLQDPPGGWLAPWAPAAHFQSGQQRGWRYSPAACAPGLPPHALPPARVMRAPPAHWLRPAGAAGARVIRRPLPCGRGGPGSGGRWTGRAHVTPAALSRAGDLGGAGRWPGGR